MTTDFARPTTNDFYIDVGGLRLFAKISGSGSPTVVFDSGCGGSSDNWSSLAAAISREATTVTYDRAGAGRSNRSPLPRTSSQMVDELHDLLGQLPAPPPYVFVGLSLGGLNVRLYAYRYPAEVAGLVLLEPAHEEAAGRFPAAFWAYEQSYLDRLQGIAYDEALTVEESSAQVLRERKPLGALPIVVVTATRKWGDAPLGTDVRRIDAIWRDLHREIAGSSSRGEQWIAENCGHNVHVQDPELVLRAIRKVIRDAR
ncbi:MAG TPA: alpha/beta hydrolase [Thermoanaerobaculia bacterium]|nr:alpha/beta hydrolase [Thermoanaerobaculia bacterium]